MRSAWAWVLVACAAPQPPIMDSSAQGVAPVVAAPQLQVADMWRWQCCAGRYAGSVAFSQSGAQLRGIFLTDEGMATYVDGAVDGSRVVFARRWLNAGRPYAQIYTATLSADGQRLAGTFIETHAPGPPIDFSAERRFEPRLQDFNPAPALDSREPPSSAPPAQATSEAPARARAADDAQPVFPPRCDCTLPCRCSGMPELMRCHDACGCPACPPGIP